MFEIKLLAECPQHIHVLSHLWINEIGKQWLPDINLQRVELKFHEHLNSDELPVTFVAIDDNKPIAMASLRINDGIRHELTPWLGGLVVHPDHRRNGVGEKLVDLTKICAKKLGHEKLYLFALDPTLPNWYTRLGWKYLGMDKFNHHPVTVMEISI